MGAALLFAMLIALQGGGGAAAPPPELRVVIAAPVYQPDGAVSVETATLSNAESSLVYIYGRRSVCDTAIAGAAEPTDAGFGWRLTAHTVSRSASDMVVSVDWRRLWDRGQKVANGPAGTVQLTLHPGDRIALDHIPNAVGGDTCRAVGMGLEVRLARVSPAAPLASSGVVLPLGAVEPGAPALDADLWLVHTQPSGVQQVLHQRVRLQAGGGAFSFAPVSFTTARGDVAVELMGSLRRLHASAAGEFLLVSMGRHITGGPAPAGGLGGTTSSLVELPGPADVLSFEMPGSTEVPARGRGAVAAGAAGGGARGGGGGGRGGAGSGAGAGAVVRMGPVGAPPAALALTILEGHVFSLRVRVTPATEK
jgi:hypothetical protein